MASVLLMLPQSWKLSRDGQMALPAICAHRTYNSCGVIFRLLGSPKQE